VAAVGPWPIRAQYGNNNVVIITDSHETDQNRSQEDAYL
jgi:hypothetical protein